MRQSNQATLKPWGHEPWQDMCGSQTVRACRICRRPILNIGAMSTSLEALNAIKAQGDANPHFNGMFHRTPELLLYGQECSTLPSRECSRFAPSAVLARQSLARIIQCLLDLVQQLHQRFVARRPELVTEQKKRK